MKKPNLFLVGHPRSGTGSIDGFLKDHPDIFMARKELHYFGSDLFYNVPARSFENYMSYFSKSGNQHYIGESSTWYLASECAASEIKSFSPNAKIIISLRKPVDWIYSLHSHMHYAAYEDTASFDQAIAKEEERLKGKLPPNASPPIGVCYTTLVQYNTQIQRFWEAFGKENVLIILFDELKSNPQQTLDHILNFLKLPTSYPAREDSVRGSKKQRNANHVYRLTRLHKWLKTGRVRSIMFGTRPEPFRGARKLLWGIHQLNTTEEARKPINPTLKNTLQKSFLSEITLLEKNLDVNLSQWKT